MAITSLQKDTQDSSKKAFHQPGTPFLLFSTLPYYFICTLYCYCFYALKYQKNPYGVIAFAFLGIPIMDYFSEDWLNPNAEQYKSLQNSIWFKIPLFILIIVDNVFFAWALYFITSNTFPWIFYPGAIFITGALAGSNFLIAHELFHKKGAFNKLIGSLTMAKSLYMHFYIEHNYGHHKNVGTPLDPATAKYGESLYEYFPRTIIGGYKSAWNIEKKRLLQFKNLKTHWTFQNKMLWFALISIILPIISFVTLGFKGLIIYLLKAIISVLVLETINYIEHYGLERKQIDGEFEKVTIKHSWNAPQRFSNYLLFKLQRHSDHHENSYKPYQVLSSKDESPMLPYGYTLCLILAGFPSMWFKILDRSLNAFKESRPLSEEEIKASNNETWKIFTFLGFIFIGLFTINSHSIN